MHGSISSEMADFRNGREPIGMQPGQLKIDKKKTCIFLCWKCTYVGYVYPVVDSFKFSREDETRLSTKAEYAQSMIPYGRLVYGHLSEEFCLLRRFHCRMAENCIGKLRGSTRVLTIRHLDEGAADVLPCKEKLSWEFTKSCCMHSNWFCWNGGFPWDLQWTSINGPRSSCKREVESLKRVFVILQVDVLTRSREWDCTFVWWTFPQCQHMETRHEWESYITIDPNPNRGEAMEPFWHRRSFTSPWRAVWPPKMGGQLRRRNTVSWKVHGIQAGSGGEVRTSANLGMNFGAGFF